MTDDEAWAKFGRQLERDMLRLMDAKPKQVGYNSSGTVLEDIRVDMRIAVLPTAPGVH